MTEPAWPSFNGQEPNRQLPLPNRNAGVPPMPLSPQTPVPWTAPESPSSSCPGLSPDSPQSGFWADQPPVKQTCPILPGRTVVRFDPRAPASQVQHFPVSFPACGPCAVGVPNRNSPQHVAGARDRPPRGGASLSEAVKAPGGSIIPDDGSHGTCMLAAITAVRCGLVQNPASFSFLYAL